MSSRDPLEKGGERDEPSDAVDVDEAGADDFAARNVVMSNALPGGASPVAGALMGDLDAVLEPSTDEERLQDEQSGAEGKPPLADKS